MSSDETHRLGRTAALLAIAPLLAFAVILLWRPWVPVLDMAMTEFRIRDVGGSNTPLIGLPGRIGEFPDNGSHPGPLSFYLVAPFYRLAGSTAWGMELASLVLNSVVVVALAWLGHRRAGAAGLLAFAALGAVAVRGYGLTVLGHPWNPYFPVLFWLLAMVAGWFALDRVRWALPVMVVAASIAAQTHLPYLVNGVLLCGVVLGVVGWRVWRGEPEGERRTWWVAIGIGAVMWLPPFVDQIVRSPGNIRRMIDHFLTDPPEDPIGMLEALQRLTQHLDVVSIVYGLLVRDDSFVHRAGQAASFNPVGVVVVLAWVAAIGWAVQRRHRGLLHLHLITAVGALAAVVSISRIFGKVWFYLTLWVSATTILMTIAIVWTGYELWRERNTGSAAARAFYATRAAFTVTIAVTALSVVSAADHPVPETNLADDVRAVMPDVVAGLEAGAGPATGKDGRYRVFWKESTVPSAQGLALMNELERRGYDVGVDRTWRVPATAHRVMADTEATAEIHFVSGRWIEDWEADDSFTRIAELDDRSADDLARLGELEAEVTASLRELGRDDVVEIMATNIFRASLVPDLPPDVIAGLEEMLQLGQPVAVYVGPVRPDLF